MTGKDVQLLEELRLANGFSDTFIESLPDGLLITNTNGKVLFVNTVLSELTGFNKQELIGTKTPFPFWPPEFCKDFNSRFKNMQKENLEHEFEATYMHKNGTRFPVLVIIESIKNKKEEIIAYLVFIQSLTSFEKDKGLEGSQKRDVFSGSNYRKKYLDFILEKKRVSQIDYTIDNISDGFVSLDSNWCYTYVNKKAGKFLGRTPDSLIGKHIWTEFPDGVGLPFYHAYYKAAETQKTQYFEDYYEPWGKWFENRIYPSAEGLTIYFTDITENKKANEIIIQKEQELNIIYETLIQPIFILKVEERHQFKFISVSKSFLNILNVTENEIINKSVNDIIPEPSLSMVLGKYKEAIQSKKTVQWEETTPYKTGVKTAIVTISPLLDSKESCTHLVGIVYDITARKRAELLLKENEKFLLEAQKIAKTGSYNLNLKTLIATTSTTFNDIVGLDINSVLTFDVWRTITHPEDTPNNQKALEKCLKTGEKFDLEYRILTKNNQELKWIHGLGEVFYNNGEATNFFGTIQDITERKKIELDLKSSKDFSEGLILTMAEGLAIVDLEGLSLDVNKALCDMTGFTKEELIGINAPFPYWPSESYQEISLGFEKTIKGEENQFNFTFKRKNGERFPVSLCAKPLKDKEENTVAFFATIQDLTEQFKAENKLRQANEFSSGLIESMHEGLLVFSKDLEIISVNPALCEMTGFTKSEIMGKKVPMPFNPPEDKKRHDDRLKKLLKGELNGNYESTYMHKDGHRFPVYIIVSNLYDSKGNLKAFFATVQDITERKKAELDLKLAKEFTDRLVMSMQEGLIIVNMEGKIILVNDSTCNILGYSKDELVGLNLPYPFAKLEDFEEISRTNEKVAKGETPAFQFEFIRKNGEKFLASFLTGNIANDKGEVIALFGTMKDISEENRVKKALEENAIKSTQKKNVILELASLVGYDFKTSLNKITQLAAETLHVERVSVWSFDENRSQIFCEKLFNLNNKDYEEVQTLKNYDNPNYFKALNNNQLILIKDAQNDSVTKKFAKDYLIPNNITSLMDVFINSTNGYYGIICFEHVGTELRDWTAEDQEFATSIANIVSLMVESTERKTAEHKILQANLELSKANIELNTLRNQLEQENIYLRNELDLVFNYEEMVYGSAAFSNVLSEVEKVASTNATVLLLGESGTGKELLARAVHNISLRSNKPLIKVNCSAIPRELIESELFGHKKGSFTGAFNDKIGKFELADGGTLFLDEIGELPLDMQPKILRFLQEGEIEVVGGTGVRKLDVRVIAATNRNLKEEVEKKQFREDLFFRLNVFPIIIPPLRDRVEDIPLLVEHFVDKFNKAYTKNIKYISDTAMAKLKAYHWQGNVRELENLIERASILSNDETLVIPGFETETQKSKLAIKKDKNLSLDTIQYNHIVSVLERCDWKISGPNGASMLLDLKPSTLRDKMSKLGIKKPK